MSYSDADYGSSDKHIIQCGGKNLEQKHYETTEAAAAAALAPAVAAAVAADENSDSKPAAQSLRTRYLIRTAKIDH